MKYYNSMVHVFEIDKSDMLNFIRTLDPKYEALIPINEKMSNFRVAFHSDSNGNDPYDNSVRVCIIKDRS